MGALFVSFVTSLGARWAATPLKVPNWVKVRERWGGARWEVLSTVVEGDRAAVEWAMHGTDPKSGRAFTFRGSDHYEFRDGLICEIRQWWTFDRDRLDVGLVDHPDLSA